jgi:hypothetical protein
MAKELIKINPFGLRPMYTFIKEVFTLDPASLNTNDDTVRVTIRPSIALLSLYKYTPLAIDREKEFRELVGMPHNSRKTISCGALSLFSPVEVPKDVSFKILVDYDLDKESKPAVYRPKALKVDFGILSSFSLYSVDIEWYTNPEAVDKVQADLKKADRKNFEELIKDPRSKIDTVIYFFERGSIVIGNLLYTLYSGKFESSIPLTRFTNILQNFGKDFNEVIERVVVAGKTLLL